MQELELLENQCKDTDVIISTALIPGRAAPKMVTSRAVGLQKSSPLPPPPHSRMPRGSVVIDFAATGVQRPPLTPPKDLANPSEDEKTQAVYAKFSQDIPEDKFENLRKGWLKEPVPDPWKGGNVETPTPGDDVPAGKGTGAGSHVTHIGWNANEWANKMPTQASTLYGNNITKLLLSTLLPIGCTKQIKRAPGGIGASGSVKECGDTYGTLPVIESLAPGGPAAEAGLQEGWCLYAKVNGEVMRNWEDLTAAFNAVDDGKSVEVGVLRTSDLAVGRGFDLDHNDEVTNGSMLLDCGSDTTTFKIEKGIEGSDFVWSSAAGKGEIKFEKPMAGERHGRVRFWKAGKEDVMEPWREDEDLRWRVSKIEGGKAHVQIGEGDDVCTFGFDAAYHPDLGTFQSGFNYTGSKALMGEAAMGVKKRPPQLQKKKEEEKKGTGSLLWPTVSTAVYMGGALSLLLGSGLAAPPVFVQQLTTLSLSVMVGYQTVWGVVPALHSPLMAVTNAISGLVVIGGLVELGHKGATLATLPHTVIGLATTAVVLSSINIAGGFNVTFKMLDMFKKDTDPRESTGSPHRGS